MMYKRYAGEFAGTDGTLWRVEIHEDSETAFSTVGELSFPYDEPLLIEWEKRAKEEVIQGSSATLKLISPGDRTYVDLYQVKPCAVRLDVYRDGALYWRGTLDTELYEEPYESASGYTVSLTFSDFGVLARKKLYGHEVQSLRAILERALEAAGLAGMEIYDGYISSRVVPAARLVPETNGPTGASSQAEAGLLDALYVSGDNFYDEDGEAITAEEVVEGVLQPLALRMIQCGGLVYVYDLNGLHAGAEKVMLEWAGATQTLGTDRVYNNVRVKWSPYVRTGNLLETDCWTAAVDEGLTDFGPEYILDGGRPSADGKCRYTTYHYTTDSDVWGDETDAGFTLWTSRTGKNADLTDERMRYFKVVPQNGGTECEGVAVMYTAVGMYGDGSDKSMVLGCMGVMPDELHAGTPKGVLFKSRLVPVTNGPTGADSQAAAGALPVDEGLYVKVTVEMLLDARSNPFETAGEWMEGARERTYQEQWNRYGNFVYVPVCVKWKDAGGKTWCWDNRQEVQAKAPAKLKSLGSTLGEWKEYTESDGKPGVWGYLAYYSGSDRENTAGVANGWAKNRPGINPHSGQVTTQLSKCEGAYVPCPAGGGELWVEVLCGGWTAADQGCDFDKTYHSTNCGFWDEYESAGRWKIRHVWMKLPAVEMVRARAFDEELDDSDITYSAELEPEAEEPLEIETICGSAAGGVPGARGVYLTQEGAQVTEITRGGHTGQIEELLIGTLYSQYASRHVTLSGEAWLAGSNGATPAGCDRGAMGVSAASSQASSQVGGLCVYFDRCMAASRGSEGAQAPTRLVPETNGAAPASSQAGQAYGYKAFVMSSSAEDVRAGTTEIEVTEFTLDEYVKVETDDNEEEEQ